MKLGVLCPSEIAFRRFMPALSKTDFEFIGIAINSPNERYNDNFPPKKDIISMIITETNKAKMFTKAYGGCIFNSYEEIINYSDIEALYIPLPPGLHYKWAKKAIEAGKHVLLEKPATTSLNDTRRLIACAEERSLALHENYMFNYHCQLDEIDKIIQSGEIGEVRLYSIRFGFPMRAINDFRYNKSLGGGSLIDAGGYCIKYATRLLGDTIHVAYSQLNNKSSFEVDVFGSGALINIEGITAQIAFGMDNDYKCELEVWGSKGTLKTGRVLTAPVGFCPDVIISKNCSIDVRKLSSDDAFEKSILKFKECIFNADLRNKNYLEIEKQAILVEDFFRKAQL